VINSNEYFVVQKIVVPRRISEINRRTDMTITDETIDYVGILAKLELSDEEKEQAKKDMSEMLDYVSKLNELDTDNVEAMSHTFSYNNVFREDEVTNGDDRENMLANAPEQKDGCYKVPRTFD
jgi:aspartyl-tRNA(Asn)/glutamyl-tRNA(Gln) amidotransferase subunit C